MKPEVQEIYDEILGQVEQLGTVRKTDERLIKRLAVNIHLVEQCEERILDEGITISGIHGLKEHPSVATKVKTEGKIREAYILLGLDFASQLKKIAADEGKDDWSDYL